MVKETKFYDLLDVSPTADENELKKAYRKKALRLHPDKGGDPELFKEVTQAYEVLSDSQKRSVYDRMGEAGLSESGGMGGMNPEDLFSQLFGGGGGGFFGGGGGGGRSAGPRKGKDLVHRMGVTLEDLYKGTTKKLALNKSVICPKCEGRGGKAGAVKSCNSCQGRGVKVSLRQLGPMLQQIQQPCNDCDGKGEVINPKDRCKECTGKKVKQERKILEVHIDKGMTHGQTITFNGAADEAPGVVTGDVVIILEQKPHEVFKRDNNDLFTEVEVDLLTALAGGAFSIKHLDERALKVNIHPGEIHKHGELKTVKNQGMPSQRHHEPGDLFVRVNVRFPDSLTPESISLLEKALPTREPLQPISGVKFTEEADLSELDPRQQREQARRETNGGDEEMEDDEQPRVQCANQ